MISFKDFLQDLVEIDSTEYKAALDAMTDDELAKHYKEQYKNKEQYQNKFGTVGTHTTRKDMIRYLIKGK